VNGGNAASSARAFIVPASVWTEVRKVDKNRKQEREIEEFLDHNKAYDNADAAVYELARIAFKAGWEKCEEYAKQTVV